MKKTIYASSHLTTRVQSFDAKYCSYAYSAIDENDEDDDDDDEDGDEEGGRKNAREKTIGPFWKLLHNNTQFEWLIWFGLQLQTRSFELN